MNLNGYISSAKKTHVAMALLALSVGYFAWIEYQRQETAGFLSVVDFVLGLREVSLSFDRSARHMNEKDLEVFLPKSRTDRVLSELRSAIDESNITSAGDLDDPPEASANSIGPIPKDDAFVINGKERRLEPRISCSYALLRLNVDPLSNSKSDAHIFVDGGLHGFAKIPLSNFYLVLSSHTCSLVHDNFATALLIDARDDFGDWVIALIPEHFDRISNRTKRRLGDIALGTNWVREIQFKKEIWLYTFSDLFVKSVYSREYYNYLSVLEFERAIFLSAQSTTGRFYRQDELLDAVDDLFLENVAQANFFGIKTSHRFFLNCAPFILFILSYTFYRRLRLIYAFPYCEIDEPWIILRVDNYFDQLLSIIWMVSPSIFFVVVYWIFADVNGAVLRVIGGYIDARLNFYPETLVEIIRGDKEFSYMLTIILVPFFVHLYLLIKIQIYMYSIMIRYRMY